MEPAIKNKQSRLLWIKRALIAPYFFCVDIFLRRKGYVFISNKMRSKFYIPYVKTDFIQRYIFRKERYFEQDNLDYICNEWNRGIVKNTIKDTIILDIGANIGNHTLYYLNECNAKKVICFEPVSDTFRILSRNVEINNLSDKAVLINAAVGESDGSAIMSSYDIQNTGMATVEPSDNGPIKMISIDNYQLFDKIGLVKIDVEGFELSVLKGMVNVLKKDKPFISIEIRDSIFDDVNHYLNELGYNYEIVKKAPHYSDCLFYA